MVILLVRLDGNCECPEHDGEAGIVASCVDSNSCDDRLDGSGTGRLTIDLKGSDVERYPRP